MANRNRKKKKTKICIKMFKTSRVRYEKTKKKIKSLITHVLLYGSNREMIYRGFSKYRKNGFIPLPPPLRKTSKCVVLKNSNGNRFCFLLAREFRETGGVSRVRPGECWKTSRKVFVFEERIFICSSTLE